MQKLINQTAVLENEWTLVTDVEAALPEGKCFLLGKQSCAN